MVIELMIVLVIVAILLALAYPSYVDYVRKSKRGEAQQMLMNWSVNLEIFRSNNPTYDSPAAEPSDDLIDYTFNYVADATSYTLTADAVGDQVNDEARDGTDCGQLTLDESGQKLPAPCWD